MKPKESLDAPHQENPGDSGPTAEVKGLEDWKYFPRTPTDCFAVVASLMELSGAYHYVRSNPRPHSRHDEVIRQLEEIYKQAKTAKIRSNNREDGEIQKNFQDAFYDTMRHLEEAAASDMLLLETGETKELTTAGRAWSLMLPFCEGKRRQGRLERARKWLLHCAEEGHDTLWFDRYYYDDEVREDGRSTITELDKIYRSAQRNYAGYKRRIVDLWPAALNRKPIESEIIEWEQEYHRNFSQCFVNLTNVISAHDAAILAIDENYIQKQWQQLISAPDARVFARRPADLKHSWWYNALRLLIMSDEASVRMGLADGEVFDWYRLYQARQTLQSALTLDENKEGSLGALANDDHEGAHAPRFASVEDNADFFAENVYLYDDDKRELDLNRQLTYNFAGLVDWDIACVFPKNRTPQTGCTIRNMSHHLALLPGRGLARASLRRGAELPLNKHAARDSDHPNDGRLNMLIIPFPFRVSASAFKRSSATEGPTHRFHVKQVWLDGLTQHNFIHAVDLLIAGAQGGGEKVNVIVFPELALNYQLHAALVQHLAKNYPDMELLIAGVSERPLRVRPDGSDGEALQNRVVGLSTLDSLCHGSSGDQRYHLRNGNYVATTSFLRFESDVQTFLTTFQAKHHRWRIHSSQIKDYALSGALSPQYSWWEDIETQTRNIEVNTFRGGSSLVALCCEDLARLEPCQSFIRAIGPNLVVAVLMDGPQIERRWPARYATVLADDPGSSVLSLTSLGLMERTTRHNHVGNRVIALWKDEPGGSREIEIPSGAHAAILKLVGRRQSSEITLDGRSDGCLATTWLLDEAIPIHDAELPTPLPADFAGRRFAGG